MFSLASNSVILIFVLLATVYFYVIKKYKYWAHRGVKYVRPKLIVGNYVDYIMRRKTIGELHKEIYYNYPDDKIVGLYRFLTPDLMIKDPDMIRSVFMTDFVHFKNRINIEQKGKVEVLMDNMFSASYDRWKIMRQTVTPVFTSGKLRNMFYLILEVADEYTKYINHILKDGNEKDIGELTAKFTTDVIGSVAFGINMNSMLDEDAPFRKIGRVIFDLKPIQFTKFALRIVFPQIYNIFNMRVHDKEIEEFFRYTIKNIEQVRRRENIRRHDFIDLMLDQKHLDDKNNKIDEDFIISQAFTFFGAGFETSSTLMCFTLYELSKNPSIQDKLFEEIENLLNINKGKITYDNVVNKMPYLDMVISESMRMYPACGAILRTCTKQYNFADTNFSIDKKTSVTIPVLAIHHDPKYYPEPEKFIPERFSPENNQNRDPMVYLPFGEGPRNCIAMLCQMSGAVHGPIINT